MFNKLKVGLSVLIIICLISISKASKGNDSLFVPHQHMVKWRILQPAVDVITAVFNKSIVLQVSYENSIKPKQSFCFDAGYIYRREKLYTDDLVSSYSNGVLFSPEYRFYLNRKKLFPRGFHFGVIGNFGFAFGETKIIVNGAQPYSFNTGWQQTPVIKSEFSIVTVGLGTKIGIQYFIGKRKQFTMDHSLVLMGTKNIRIQESKMLSEYYRMYPINNIYPYVDLMWTLGYSFGNYKTKTHLPEIEEEHKWSIGIHAAPSGAVWYGNGDNKKIYQYQNSPKLAFDAGITVQYKFQSKFALCIEANYERKGTIYISSEFMQSNGSHMKYNYSSDYISIPVIAKFIAAKNKLNLFVNTGVNPAYLIKVKSRLYPNEYSTGYTKDGKLDNRYRLDLSLLTGVGFVIPVTERTQFSTELRNNLGLTNIYKNYSYNFKNETFALLLGASYKL